MEIFTPWAIIAHSDKIVVVKLYFPAKGYSRRRGAVASQPIQLSLSSQHHHVPIKGTVAVIVDTGTQLVGNIRLSLNYLANFA